MTSTQNSNPRVEVSGSGDAVVVGTTTQTTVQTLTHGESCPPWSQYKTELLNAPQENFKLKRNSGFTSHLVTMVTKTATHQTELITHGANTVIGYQKPFTPRAHHHITHVPTTATENTALQKWLSPFVDKAQAPLQTALKILDGFYETLPPQKPSKHLKGSETANQVLQALQKGDHLQCGQVATLFAKSLNSFGKTARVVTLWRYHPALPNITPNTHAVVEVFEPAQDSWVCIDPSYYHHFETTHALSVNDTTTHIKNNTLAALNVHTRHKPKQNYTAELILEPRDACAYDYFSHFY